MRLMDALAGRTGYISYEVFPPKDDAGAAAVVETLRVLGCFEPAYVSVTYGAGGSTRSNTIALAARIKKTLRTETMAHLTCVGATRAELAAVLDDFAAAGIENVLALRGDPPKGTSFTATEGGLSYGSELVSLVRAHGPFGIAAACYPEAHPEAVSAETDLDHLAHKVECGVDFLVTQLFFDAKDYFDFVERARARGIACPIIPGILPITSVAQALRFAALCGARVPDGLRASLEEAEDSPEAVLEIGVAHAIAQCRALRAGGAPGLHVYTLNRSEATKRILEGVL
jgi:methylenetetrahydrofolate reductase (NADPH)